MDSQTLRSTTAGRPGVAGAWLAAARPRTLPAACLPVALGTALAWSTGAAQWVAAVLCLAFALLIQVATNFANDYFDWKQGADGVDRQGPARAVASGWIAPQAMRRATVAVFGLAFIAGCGLIPYGGPWLIAVGVVSIICGVAYTGGPYPLAYNGLGELFVILFFGLVATGFTYYVQTATFAWGAVAPHWNLWLMGLVPGALATNLLVVNNHRDRATDQRSGKRTLAVVFGLRFAEWEYRAMLVVAYGVPLLMAVAVDNWLLVLPLLTAPWGYALAWQLPRLTDRQGYAAHLAATARLMTGHGLLLVLAIVLAG
jgi:1,4-dihydroxy-2-naphthoate polyprenyltransferase